MLKNTNKIDKKRRKIGRKPLINDKELTDTIIKYIEVGNYTYVACEAAGVHQSTYFKWLQKAEEAIAEGKTNQYVEFFEAIKRAEKKAEVMLTANIKTAASKGAWQASAFLLERKYPGRWGRKDQIQQNIEGSLRVDASKISDEELAEKIKEMKTKIEKVATELPEPPLDDA